MRTAPATSLQSEINVTPLVDVCLVLLIIFMVVTPMLVGIPVHLPQTATGDQLANKPIQITINADGTIYLDRLVIRGEQLASELQRKHDQVQRPIVVRADKALTYGKVVSVLDACRNAGFESVGLAADKQPPPEN